MLDLSNNKMVCKVSILKCIYLTNLFNFFRESMQRIEPGVFLGLVNKLEQ